MAKEFAYEFVTTDGQRLGRQSVRKGRPRVWDIGDTIQTEGPPGRLADWVVVNVEGLRVTFAPAVRAHLYPDS